MESASSCLGAEPVQAALTSPEMAAAVEDTPNFLDMHKTGLVVVEEKLFVTKRRSPCRARRPGTASGSSGPPPAE